MKMDDEYRFLIKPNYEILIVSIGTILFGICFTILGIIGFGKKYFIDYNSFLVIHLLSYSFTLIGVLFLIGYLFHRRHYIAIGDDSIKFYNGINKNILSIMNKDISEIIYCNSHDSAMEQWKNIDPLDRPYGYFKKGHIIIKLINSSNKPKSLRKSNYILYFLKDNDEFISQINKVGINIEIK